MARVIYSRPCKTNSQPQRVIAPRKAPRQLPTKAPRTQTANSITKSPRHSPIPADGPSTYYQGAEHYHGAVKFPPPRRNPLRKTRQVKQESEMPSNTPYHELGRKYSQDFKNSEIVTEDEPDWMDCEYLHLSLILLDQVIISGY